MEAPPLPTLLGASPPCDPSSSSSAITTTTSPTCSSVSCSPSVVHTSASTSSSSSSSRTSSSSPPPSTSASASTAPATREAATVPTTAQLQSLFRNELPHGMLECMLEQVRRPLTAEERQRGKEETIRFYSVLDERLSKANLAPRKEAHGHVHNCAASLSSAFVAMNWPPAEDVLAYGPGLFQENNYSLTSMIGRSAGLDTPGVEVMDISPFAFNRDQSGKYPYAALDEDIRSFTDAAFYCEVLRGVSAGSRVILCAGAEVQDALRRGQKSRRNQAVKEDLIKVYGEEVVNLPDYVFTKKSINYIAGPGKFNPMSYSFFTVRLPLQREDQATLLLPAHSFAKKLYSGLNNLLFQATALQAFFCPLKVARTAAEEKYCTHTMHQDIQTAPTEILNKFMRYVPKKKMTYDEYYYEAADVAEWMKNNLMKADNREQLLRLLPGLAEPVDFASVLEEAAKKSESLPQLVNLIWLAHSKKTKRERADGTLDSEKKKKLDQKAIDRKVYDDKLRNATHLTCYRCGVTKADYWAFSCGEERNETACRPCYVKERQERNQQVTHLQCCVETCQTTSSAVWMFCGGEEEDQPICQRCYGRLKVERMQKKTEYTCCECGVTTAKYWYMNGGESKDQTICLPCYDSNRPKRPLADAEHKCAACKVNGRYTTSGPPEYRDLCSGCYLRYRRSITGFYNEISCPAPCWGSSVKYCLTKKCRSHCAGKVKNKPRCYCQLEKTGAESEVDELDSEVDELDSE